MSCYLLYVGDIVSARSSAGVAMCRFIGHRVRDLSVVSRCPRKRNWRERKVPQLAVAVYEKKYNKKYTIHHANKVL